MTLPPLDIVGVAGKLTKAQREVLLRCDDRVWSRHDIHPRTFGALFKVGIASDLRAAGYKFFNWTDHGLAVREYLKGQTNA